MEQAQQAQQAQQKRGPKERPMHSLADQQKLKRMIEKMYRNLNELQLEANASNELMAKMLAKLVHPAMQLCQEGWQAAWQKENLDLTKSSKKLSEEKLEKILLGKLDGLIPNNSYSTLRDFGELEQLPSRKAINKTKESVNQKLKEVLKLDSEETLVSCSIGVEECVKFIFRLHLKAFGNNSLPADVTFKFSFDGRPIEGRQEVVIGLVPIDTRFSEQSGFSSFPIEILQCSEKEAQKNIKKIAEALVDIEKKGVKWLADDLFNCDGSYRVKFVICSDLVATWRACNMKNYSVGTNNQFCPKCLRTCKQVNNLAEIKRGSDELRDLLPELNIPAKNYIYCALHAGMRITERFIEAIITPLKKAQRKQFQKEARSMGVKVDLRGNNLAVSMQGHAVKDMLYDSSAFSDDGHTLKPERLCQLPLDLKPVTDEVKTLVDWYMKSDSSKDEQSSVTRRQNMTLLLNTWAAVFMIIAYNKDLTEMHVIALKSALDSMRNSFEDMMIDFATPYFHLLFCHTIDIIEEHKSIGKYSQQGFEQANSLHRSTEIRASNHGGGNGKRSVTEQLMNHWYGRLYLAHKYGVLKLLKKKNNRVYKKKKQVDEETESDAIETKKKGLKRKRVPTSETKARKRQKLNKKIKDADENKKEEEADDVDVDEELTNMQVDNMDTSEAAGDQ